jgi:nucleoid-associated protein EbfC
MFGDKFNLGSLMKNAKKMQEMMEQTQEELAKIEVMGESGAGAVKVTLNARHFTKNIDIDADILKESKEVLEELIAAAFNDAAQKIEAVTKSKMMDTSQLFGADLSGDDSQT